MTKKSIAMAAGAALLALAGLFALWPAQGDKTTEPPAAARPPADPNTVTVSETQAKVLKIVTVGAKEFADEREAVGHIDFNQDKVLPVSAPWTGRISQILVKAGDDVRQGQTLYVIDSPDLVQAESALIAAAGVLQMANKALERTRRLFEAEGAAQKDLDQAISDHQTAEANDRAARRAVRIFGKSDAEIDRIVASRQTDGQLSITSPIAGRVTARNAAIGQLVEPDGSSGPVTVADISSRWMVANVPEHLLPRMRIGARVAVAVNAYPGRRFEARISNIGAAVDPNTRTVTVRSEIADPKHELLPQMLATFVIRTGEPQRSPAVPVSGVVREGDGTMTVFVTQDGLRFERRVVRVGFTQDGLQQILEGVQAGEQVAAEGALFLSNQLALGSR